MARSRAAVTLSLAAVTLGVVGDAASAAQPPARIDPFVASDLAARAPVIVHDSRERSPLASVRGSGVPGTEREPRSPAVYARRAGDWLQYWLWFADNPQDRGLVRSGRHAGDWELVQFRKSDGEAVYAQHSGAERCPAAALETRDGRPVVYLANGSHAAYFHAGTRDRTWPDPNDEADGRGVVLRPRLIEVSSDSPVWMRYPGRWGGARAGWFPSEQSSPRGPAFQPQGRWSDPAGWARRARSCTGRRCVRTGACDGAETALAGGAAALALLGGLGLWRRRRA